MDSLKSPTLGIWPFSCFPKMLPWLSITTAVLCKVYLFLYLSKIEETMTILCFLASSLKNWVDSPSNGSENYTQGYLSRVHMKNGAVHIYWRQTTFACYRAAISMIFLIRSIIASFCLWTGSSVSKTILFWIAAIFIFLGSLIYYLSQFILNCFTSTFNSFFFKIVSFFKAI